MTNLKFEQISNEAKTTLNGAINSSVTTLTVDDKTDFPTDGNFRILIGSEIMKVESISGLVFTVVRGREGTVATAHSDGVQVTLIITSDAFKRHIADYVPFGNSEVRPKLNSLTDASGNTLTASSFNFENQGTATVTDLPLGGILLDAPIATSGPVLRGLSKAIPTDPYTIIAGFKFDNWGDEGGSGTFPSIGLGFHATNDKSLNILSVNYSVLQVSRYTDHTTFTANDFSSDWWYDANQTWLRIQDDGSRSRFAVSLDGVEWQEVYDVNRTLHFLGQPSEIWWLCNFICTSTSKTPDGRYKVVLNHWSETED